MELEVFFDYACPFCIRGHEYLASLIAAYPSIDVVWRPCEAHPRPERYGPHSDLCIQGMFFAQERGIDLWEYHKRIYKAAHVERVDIEDIGALAECVSDLVDPAAFALSLKQGEFTERVHEANRYAYERSGVWAMPSYRMGGKKLDSIEGIGVSKRQLEKFLDSANGYKT